MKRLAAAVLAVLLLQGGALAKDKADKTRPSLPEQAAPAAQAAVAESGAIKVTASLTAPADGSSYTAPAQIVLTADATSSLPNHPITEVHFYQGTVLLGTRTAAPYSFTWSNAPAGNYQLTAQAINAKGDTATSPPVAINVNDPPTIGLITPQDNTRATAPASIELVAQAADSDGSIANVAFYNGSTLLGTVTEAPYRFQWNAIPAGSYTITARATDNQGASTVSGVANVHVNAPPTITLTTPTEGAQFVSPRPILLGANAADSDGSIQTVTFYHGTTEIGSVTEAPYLMAWSGAEPGNYPITARATDNEGASTITAGINITVVPNQLPSVTLATSIATPSAPATVELTATASDVDGTIHEVTFYNGETLLATVTQAPFRYVWTEVPEGSYTLTAKATDDLGGSATSEEKQVTITSGKAQVYYIHPDHLNTPRVITDSNNTVVWKWDNDDPFGNNVPNEDPNATGKRFEFNLRFPGQYFDRETGLHYNYFRDCYDPATGRYCQSDPIGNVLYGDAAARNLFAARGPVDPKVAAQLYSHQPVYNHSYNYAEGNPVRYVDPLGLWSVTVEAYRGGGGGVTFGRDPNTGQPFMTTRAGWGIGGGIKWDKNGGRPGSDGLTNACKGSGAGVGVFADIDFNAGPLQVGLQNSFGTNTGTGLYGQFMSPTWSVGDSWGIKAGGAFGAQFTVWTPDVRGGR